MQHSARFQQLQINRERLIQNIRSIQAVASSGVGCVVKGNAYGHDLVTASGIFLEAGAEILFAFHPAEGFELRKNFPGQRIILLGPVDEQMLPALAEAELEIFIWDLSFLRELLKVGQQNHLSHPISIHIEIETGMYRTGMEPSPVQALLEQLLLAPQIELRGICTHLSGADESDNLDRVKRQIDQFHSLRNSWESQLPDKVMWHGANSAGLLLDATRDIFDITRVGLLAYGFFPSPLSRSFWPKEIPPPQPAMRLLGKVSGTHHIPSGIYTGYGKSYQNHHFTATALLPVGYGDGFPRTLSNQWKVKLEARMAPAIGRVNMNWIVIDCGSESAGQEMATIIDRDPPFDWYEAAEKSGLFLYELLSGLNPRIPRVVV